ncbi:hypothetical protein DQ04_07901030 [Trypanosoma grayi]|uniref:hypothetical protein n=1 Tax=Trypanosoma grayi TaxID=71804 RepID=UPI0004F40F85|nr:hypothetical protein DQ04_07901030 [Trypanosoma grayi]KEG08146.1 hypothetical protein DQ04_07901030 [Trypanosoma grayi]
MQGVVYYGERFVEVPDASVTLKDICASFGLSGDLSGVCIKNRVTGRVVATLPFESLPATASLCGEEDNTYDLCDPAHHADGNGDDETERAPTTDDMTDILKQLVQLGATSLLTMQMDSQASLDSYDPRTSPGFLMRTIYPPSIYSPYRYCGDPLRTSSATHNVGAPYVSAVEPYNVEEATETALRQRPDLIRQSEEEAQDILHGLVVAATQAKTMRAMADVEEERRAPLDVKPNLQSIQLN